MSRALQACFVNLGAIVLLSTVSLQAANAGIRCQGEFQVTQYGPIAIADVRSRQGMSAKCHEQTFGQRAF